jgi:hypothetical protein
MISTVAQQLSCWASRQNGTASTAVTSRRLQRFLAGRTCPWRAAAAWPSRLSHQSLDDTLTRAGRWHGRIAAGGVAGPSAKG